MTKSALWRDPEMEVPPDDADYDYVLAIVTGVVNGVRYEHAPALAMYDFHEGWWLTDLPEKKVDHWKIDAWMPIPEWEGDNG